MLEKSFLILPGHSWKQLWVPWLSMTFPDHSLVLLLQYPSLAIILMIIILPWTLMIWLLITPTLLGNPIVFFCLFHFSNQINPNFDCSKFLCFHYKTKNLNLLHSCRIFFITLHISVIQSACVPVHVLGTTCKLILLGYFPITEFLKFSQNSWNVVK